MRTLHITESEQFSLLYESIVLKQGGYNMQQGRIAAKILDKLEDVGIVDNDNSVKGQDGQIAIMIYKSRSLPIDVKLEDAEYDLVKQSLDAMPWSGRAVRKAVRVVDWFTAVPADEVKK